MKFHALALCGAAMCVAAPAFAQSDAERFAPMQANDAYFSCEQLQQEAGVMEQVIGSAPQATFTGNELNEALGFGRSLARDVGAHDVANALGGFGGTLGNALGGLTRGASQQQQQAQDSRREMAQDRWYYLAGLYTARGCAQQSASAIPPAPVPAGPIPPAPMQ